MLTGHQECEKNKRDIKEIQGTLSSSFSFFFPPIYLFIYLERQRACGQGRGRERGRQRILSRPHTISIEPDSGLKLKTCVETELDASLIGPFRCHPLPPLLKTFFLRALDTYFPQTGKLPILAVNVKFKILDSTRETSLKRNAILTFNIVLIHFFPINVSQNLLRDMKDFQFYPSVFSSMCVSTPCGFSKYD